MGAYLSFNASLEIQGHRWLLRNQFSRVARRYTQENNKTVAKQSAIVTINDAMRGNVVISNNYRLSTPTVPLRPLPAIQSVNSTLNVERAGRRFARICDMRFSPFENPSGVDLKKFACPSKYPSKRWSVDLWFRAMESNFFFIEYSFHSFIQSYGHNVCIGQRVWK